MPPLPTFLRKSFLTMCRAAPKTCSEIVLLDGLKIIKTKIAPVRSYLYESVTLCPRTATIQRLDWEKRPFYQGVSLQKLATKIGLPLAFLFLHGSLLHLSSKPYSSL